MKLTHKLDPAPWTSKTQARQYAAVGKLRYVHSWYSDEPGPHHGDRLGYQVLLFSSAEDAEKWIAAENAPAPEAA
jgi:hypothetical protein